MVIGAVEIAYQRSDGNNVLEKEKIRNCLKYKRGYDAPGKQLKTTTAASFTKA